MLARLILAVLLAAFAVPGAVAAPCHDAPMAMADHAVSGGAHREAITSHSCIGCIPPSDWTAARVFAPIVVAITTPAGFVARLDLANGWPPALPPPRIG